jgi:hypothetical protein
MAMALSIDAIANRAAAMALSAIPSDSFANALPLPHPALTSHGPALA